MPPEHSGALRAFALLRVLDRRRRPLRFNEVRQELEVEGIEDLPKDVEAVDQVRRRAIEDLRAMGVSIDVVDGAITMNRGQDPSVESMLRLSAEQLRLRHRIRAMLRYLDPDYAVEVQEGAFVKMHMPRDRIRFVYGSPASTFEGIPYEIKVSDRNLLLVRTDDRDVGLWIDAIRSLEMIEANAGHVTGVAADPAVISADPVGGSVWKARPGRPPDLRNLRDGQRVLALLDQQQGVNAPVADPVISIRDVSRRSGLTPRRVLDLLPLVSRLGAVDVVAEGPNLCVYPGLRHQAEFVDAGQGLVARLDAAALQALQGGHLELAPDVAADHLADWIDQLDEFLSAATVSIRTDDCPCARNIIAAIMDGVALTVSLEDDGAEVLAEVRPSGLQWHRNSWWVQGEQDGKPLRPQQLRLTNVVATF